MNDLFFCAKLAFYITIFFVSCCFVIALVMALIEDITDKKNAKKGKIKDE